MFLAKRRASATIVAASLAFSLVACSSDDTSAEGAKADGQESSTITIEDNFGSQAVPQPAERVVVTDNGAFELASMWGVEPVAAPMKLVPKTITFPNQDRILDMGNHKEPDLEKVVEADPDLIINGNRFAKQRDKLVELAPNAAIVDLSPRDGEPLGEELIRETEGLGTIFGKEDEAGKIIDDYKAAVDRVKKAYNGQTAMGVIVSGGEINYSAPGTGRTVGPVFDMVGLKPALEAKGTTDHQGDDISVEAIADSNPQLILVMDRDAAIGRKDGKEAEPAETVIEKTAALKNVDAVKNGLVVTFPADTYINENIITYTEFLNGLADALEAAGKGGSEKSGN